MSRLDRGASPVADCRHFSVVAFGCPASSFWYTGRTVVSPLSVRRTGRVLAVAIAIPLLCGCARGVPALPPTTDSGTSVVFGRTLVVLTSPTTRAYEPQVRSFEVVNRSTQERVRVEVRSSDSRFMITLPAGKYQLGRVQISEGPFLSMADYVVEFAVASGQLTYVVTWRFGIDSPRYDRMMVFSAVPRSEERERALQELSAQHPALNAQFMTMAVPSPAEVDARLYEVMPYPR